MSVWDSIGTTYVEAATSKLPLHRVVVFAVGFVGSVSVHHQTHISIFETIARIRVSELTSLSSGLIGKAVLADVLLGSSLVLIGWIFTRLVLRTIFSLAAALTDLWERMQISAPSPHIHSLQSLSELQTALEIIDKLLSEPRARLRSLCAAAELLGGLGVGCLVAAFWGNILDGILGAAISIVAIGLQVSAVQLFIGDYLGLAMLKAKLQGRKAPEPTGFV